MRATCWHGKHDMRVDDVPDPAIMNRRDAIAGMKIVGCNERPPAREHVVLP